MQAVVLFDGKETQVHSTTTVTATLLPTNDSPPRFDRSSYTATVTTGTAVGALVPSLNMLVTDPDAVRIMSLIEECLFIYSRTREIIIKQ